MGRNKSPGPDGLTAEFIQDPKVWGLIGQDLLDALNSAKNKLKHKGGHDFDSFNEGIQYPRVNLGKKGLALNFCLRQE